MERRTKIVLAGVAALAVAGTATGAAVAAGGNRDDAEPPISGAALERASEAALAHTGGGRVTDTEMGDEESFYEVEVTLDDGRQVDVQLDEAFQVVGDEVDEADEGDEGDETDDD